MSDCPKFPAFDRYAIPGETVALDLPDGWRTVATIHHDSTMGAPWKEHDGHGPVSEWRRKDSKRPGERVLNQDHDSCRFYDFAEACRIARRDGWGVEGGRLPGESARAYAARAAEHDFRVLKAWCDDEWTWCGVAVTVSRHDVDLTGTYDHALWGIELNYPGSDNAYLSTVADELLAEAMDAARAKLATLCKAEA